MNESTATLDIFSAGSCQYALPGGSITRVAHWPCPLPPLPPRQIRLETTEGEPARLIFCGAAPGLRPLALSAAAASSRFILIVERLLQVQVAPRAVYPLETILPRFCGIDFLTAMACWTGGEALVLRLEPLAAHLKTRRKYEIQP